MLPKNVDGRHFQKSSETQRKEAEKFSLVSSQKRCWSNERFLEKTHQAGS